MLSKPWRAVALVLLAGAAVIRPVAGKADEPSGTAVAVVQATEAEGAASGSRLLAVEGPVFMGDRIKTGAIGSADLRFRDETKLVVGPNSQLLIDKFVFANETSAKDVSISAVRGAFRFITGASPKRAYSIHTPTATIGVQGTQFDFSVGDAGETDFVLYEGRAKLCDLAGHCIWLSGSCSIASLKQNQATERVTRFGDRAALLNKEFPYFQQQDGLLKEFRVNTSNCLVRKAQIVPAKPAIKQATFADASPELPPGSGPVGGGPAPGGGGPKPPGGGGGAGGRGSGPGAGAGRCD